MLEIVKLNCSLETFINLNAFLDHRLYDCIVLRHWSEKEHTNQKQKHLVSLH